MAAIYILLDDILDPTECNWWDLTPGEFSYGNYCSCKELLSKMLNGYKWITVADRNTGIMRRYEAKESFFVSACDEKIYTSRGEPGVWRTTKTGLHYFIKEGQDPAEALKEALKQRKLYKRDFIRFPNGGEVSLFFDNDDNQEYWEGNIGEERRNAINFYTHKKRAVAINGELRKKNIEERNIDGEMSKQISLLDDAIDSHVLTRPIEVYRAMPLKYFKLDGNIYWDNAYFSTSCYKKADIIKDIVKNNEKACLMIIEIPAGKGRGAYIDNLSKFKGREYEFLIKRLARFRVSSIKYTEEGAVVRMRMICED